ncbi:---NA---, partial [Paramuricea clavata]
MQQSGSTQRRTAIKQEQTSSKQPPALLNNNQHIPGKPVLNHAMVMRNKFAKTIANHLPQSTAIKSVSTIVTQHSNTTAVQNYATAIQAQWVSNRTKERVAKLESFFTRLITLATSISPEIGKYVQELIKALVIEDENHRSETCGETIERKLSEHVVDVAGKDEVNRKHSICEECQNRKDEITEIKAIINEIKTNQNEDREKSIIKALESDERIKSLHEENSKMTEEIKYLKATISELFTDNENIKNILDVKQNEWLKIAENPNPSKCSKTATTPPTTS